MSQNPFLFFFKGKVYFVCTVEKVAFNRTGELGEEIAGCKWKTGRGRA